ncbi:hypothetical protein IFM89_020977 [Coptis chinensis]|uniref:Uncharacterized protein n=1 Tax=Coptis chinensis TaxID=261450 RepID=A0A835IBA8_9MAGN|nr:hypothetical protein IFM89_020977 [Coptis chinensis]
MDSSGGGEVRISAEEVIAKLKDDGDFDKLRLKIIQKLKENEQLRNNIVLTVRQSSALNREGAENLKPRQLSDAIHEEIGNTVTGQISDALWGVIRSTDGMKTEINDTVESVYNRLLNPKVPESSPPRDPTPGDREALNNCSVTSSVPEGAVALPSSEVNEAPIVSAWNNQQVNGNEEQKEDAQPVIPHDQPGIEEKEHQNLIVLSPCDDDLSVPPGFAAFVKSEPPCDGGDDDPDVPPGFG